MNHPRRYRLAMTKHTAIAKHTATVKRIIAALAIALLTALTVSAQSDDAAAIKALNVAWIHAYMTKDTAIVSRIWADDIVLINPAGKKVTKPEMLHNLVSGPDFQSAVVDTADVRLVGNVGLIMAHVSFTFTLDGKVTTGHTGYLDVYEKQKGKWVCIAGHVTSLND
jgi:uncharacterized protein (TIGR02246 family)